MPRRVNDLTVMLVITILFLIMVLTGLSNTFLQVVLALPAILVLPGYALTAALFPARALKTAERLIFTLGLSLTVMALGGFILNLTAWGLQPVSWALFLSSVTLGASAGALVRRRRSPDIAPGALPVLRVSARPAVLLTLAALIVAGSVAVAAASALQRPAADFTQFWILPAVEADQPAVRLGIHSAEPARVQYRLHLTIEGQTAHEEFIELEPGGVWEARVRLPADLSGTELIAATLYQAQAPDLVYRRVELARKQ